MSNMDQVGPSRHEERTVWAQATPEEVFAFADDHLQFAAHMASSSGMMLGGKMSTRVDAARGQEIGSHITMEGSILGFRVYLDEVVIERVIRTQRSGRRSVSLDCL